MSLISVKATILSMFDENGVWTGPGERVIFINGEMFNIDDHAEAEGYTLPDAGD